MMNPVTCLKIRLRGRKALLFSQILLWTGIITFIGLYQLANDNTISKPELPRLADPDLGLHQLAKDKMISKPGLSEPELRPYQLVNVNTISKPELPELAEPELAEPELSEDPQVCAHPKLDPFDKAIHKFYEKMEPLHCSSDINWIDVQNGTIVFQDEAFKEHGGFECTVWPIIREDDFTTKYDNPIVNIKTGFRMTFDFFKIECKGKNGSSYVNLHSGVGFNADIHRTLKKTLKQNNRQNNRDKTFFSLNVLMFGFDSISHMSWKRNLPKSYKYFTEILKGNVLQGYNIAGDGTPQNLLPILTGKTEKELPEARRGHDGAQPVDGHPWIWKQYAKKGYVTQYGEDDPQIGAFHYRMLGFKEQPTHHYLRPFYMKVNSEADKLQHGCFGSVPRHVNMLNWMRDSYTMYRDTPKFMFTFHGELSHGNMNGIQVVDEDLRDWLKHMNEQQYFENTALILMSDHGVRFSEIRQSVQGKLEERLPFFGLRFPNWFKNRYSKAIKNLEINQQRLTTPFDIHETLEHLLNMEDRDEAETSKRGISLFQEIPKSRSCQDADIEAHWCACLNWNPVPNDNPAVVKAVSTLLKRINRLTAPQRSKCAPLSIEHIVNAVELKPNTNLLKFKQSLDIDGRIPDLSDNLASTEILYQVTVVTKPGGGHFESTIIHSSGEDTYKVEDRQISRINKYGNDPHCIVDTFPHLSPYCYCNKPK